MEVAQDFLLMKKQKEMKTTVGWRNGQLNQLLGLESTFLPLGLLDQLIQVIQAVHLFQGDPKR